MADRSLLQAAHSALAAGDRTQAQKLLVRLLKSAPYDAEAWLLMAEAQADPQRRRECLERAARLAASAATPATVAVPVKAAAQAVLANGAPRVIEPEQEPAPASLLDQALAAYHAGDRAESERLLGQVIQRNPRNADAWALRAEIQLVPARKRQFAERAVALRPGHELAAAILTELGPEPAAESGPVAPAYPAERVQPPSVEQLLAIAARQEQELSEGETKHAGVESPFYLAWFIALVNPSRDGYEALRDDPQASVTRGSIWVFLTGLVYLSVLFATQLSGVLAGAGVLNPTPQVLVAVTFVVAVVGSVASLLALYLNGLIISVTAGALGGEGSFRNQVYLSAAYMAPLQLLQAALVAIPTAGVFLTVGLSLYTFWLSINATRVAQEVGALRALVVLILPGMLLFGAVLAVALTLAPSLQR